MEEYEIPFHNASISGEEQGEILEGFNSGRYPLIVATPTLAAGVNLGSMTVIIRGATRGHTDIATSQLLQMIGRAGRQREAMNYPDQPAKGYFYIEEERAIHHQRRITSGAYLESKMASEIEVVDNVLRAIQMGGVKNFHDLGGYICSTFAQFQSSVDETDPHNVRRGLEAISVSANSEEDDFNWMDEDASEEPIDPKLKGCKHPEITEERGETRGVGDLWEARCNICGKEGLAEKDYQPLTNEDYLRLAENAIRDLVQAGFVVIEPGGLLKVTSLGRSMSKSQMETSMSVDIVRNMVGYDPSSQDVTRLPIALGNIRANSDEGRGNYITKEQGGHCREAGMLLGDPECHNPATKVVQCLIWSLQGVSFEDVPQCLRRDYAGTKDDYGGQFLRGFGELASRAEWFKGAGEKLLGLEVQLTNQVSEEGVPFACVSGISQKRAMAIVKAGFTDSKDFIDQIPWHSDDIRIADLAFHMKGKKDKQGRYPPSEEGYGTLSEYVDYRVGRGWKDPTEWVHGVFETVWKFIASGLKGKRKSGYDIDYQSTVALLNGFDWAKGGKTLLEGYVSKAEEYLQASKEHRKSQGLGFGRKSWYDNPTSMKIPR